MNSLLEPIVIQELYKASQAGVKIDLVVQGRVCSCGLPCRGCQKISPYVLLLVASWSTPVCFIFTRSGEEKVYLSSADWMDRNFFRRVESGVSRQ
jgi:polyphosphate kinase